LQVRALPPLLSLLLSKERQRQLAVVTFSRRLSAVAVGTAHVALGDLCFDGRPARVPYETADGCALCGRIAVVELQDDQIRLAAIDARMSHEIVHYTAQVFHLIDSAIAVGISDVRRLVALIMRPVPRVLTLTAERVKKLRVAVLEVEVAQRLEPQRRQLF
jgi:hypothetical protein